MLNTALNTSVRMEVLQDLLLYGNQLCSWTLSGDLQQLLCSNCSNQEFFYTAFLSSSISDRMLEHFAASNTPVIAADDMGLAWMGVVSHNESADMQSRPSNSAVCYLLGPFFTVEASQTYIRQMCLKSKTPLDLTQELTEKLKFLPTITLAQAIRYAIMLHYAVNGDVISPSDVTQYNEYDSLLQTDDPDTETTSHGTWEMEQELFANVREGRLTTMSSIGAKFAGGNVGVMSEDALRQAKNEVIIFASLCCRAAIQGGMSPEGGYNLADYYIRLVESTDSIGAIQQISAELYETFIRRVRQVHKNSSYPPIVASALEYIETHIKEKISLEEMGKELGYTAYYISERVQSSLGMNINSYIKGRKIEIAKEYLLHTNLSQAEISDRLAFSSPSYFASVFRTYTGMTTTEFIRSSSSVAR